MFKSCLFILLMLALVSSACRARGEPSAGTQPFASQLATATQAAATLEPASSSPESPIVRATATAEPIIAIPSDLRIVYLQDGNLWSWTEADGNVLLIGTGDLSAVRLSADGLLLAFMRGPEVWTIHMDGTDARPLVKQEKEGGSLSFVPAGSILAVSTADHIDVIDLKNATSSTVLTYQILADSYYPQVVWSMDGTGFKTVVPPNSVSGRAEFLFVFTDGKKASLAKFEMLPPAESPAFISPDGGYVIFVAKQERDKESLFLMDSSGAAKPYGESARSVRAYGWLPYSLHFLYALEGQNRMFIGDVTGGQPVEMFFDDYESMRWIDPEHFLAIKAGDLYLEDINGGEMLIAEGVSDFDFGK